MYPAPDSTSSSKQQAPRILVVGAGALGCAALRTLARDGRARVTVVDDDVVERSNLQRQVLYTDADIGRSKVAAVATSLARDPGIAVETVAARLDTASGPSLVASADLVLDATDDPATKFLLNRLCVGAGVAYVYGGVVRTGGQWMLVVPGETACLECVFPAPAPGAVESAEGCSAMGVLAPVAGLVGAMQALTALAFLARMRRPARDAGRLHVYELTGARSRHVDFPPAAGCFCRSAGRVPRDVEEADRIGSDAEREEEERRKAS